MLRRMSDASPEWLIAALRAAGHDVEVASVDAKPLGVGIGMMSGLVSLEITYAHGTGPAALVLKMPAETSAWTTSSSDQAPGRSR